EAEPPPPTAPSPPRPGNPRRRKPGDSTPIQLTVTVDYDTLRDQLADRSKALALLGDATWIRPETVRQLACDAEIIPIVLGSKGEVLDVGRKSRTPPAGLRRAIWARDRHCAFPGCRRRARHSQIHHIQHWGHDGDTELDNLVCLCIYHHGLVHRSGWQIVMDQRLPWFIPPKWLDPTQTPRHNRPWTLAAA
ncbi:HNH endonuclease signature motif containing protein, partial [Actinomycetospora termitidis]